MKQTDCDETVTLTLAISGLCMFFSRSQLLSRNPIKKNALRTRTMRRAKILPRYCASTRMLMLALAMGKN